MKITEIPKVISKVHYELLIKSFFSNLKFYYNIYKNTINVNDGKTKHHEKLTCSREKIHKCNIQKWLQTRLRALNPKF